MARPRLPRIDVSQPDGPYRLIPLTKGQVAKVSAYRYEELSKFNWCAYYSADNRSFYAVRRFEGRTLSMHRAILGLRNGDSMCGDHINRDTLDNRDENLRLATRAQNQYNKRQTKKVGKYKGVSWHSQNNYWRARIAHDRKILHIGVFDSEVEAALAVDAKAKELHGEFAYLNFPVVG